MFRQIVDKIPEGANALFTCHPSVLTTLLEVAWSSRRGLDKTIDFDARKSGLQGLPQFWLDKLTKQTGTSLQDIIKAPATVLWDHLIYAYMIENTRIYEIFRRVLHEFIHGEKLGVPDSAAQQWLRNTEELFYRDPPPFSILNIVSHIRPDLRATRRNAYWRMFGMDLNHGTDDGQPYAYAKTEAANNEFVNTFEEFLRESWVAITNIDNTAGSNPTDQGKLENLAQALQDMLLTRRESGNLSREEFSAVCTMSWFHLTLSFNESHIVKVLRAEAASPEQRLFKIAQRVGLPAHGLSKSYFEIADPISRLLLFIEAEGKEAVKVLLDKDTGGTLRTLVNSIITHWSIITGRDIKAGKVAVR